MNNNIMYHAWDLPSDIDMARIYDTESYFGIIKEIRNWHLKIIIKGAKLHDEEVGDKDKPRKWYLIGSYFYYKVYNYPEYADKEHLVLGTYCFLNSLRCLTNRNEYYNSDLSTISAARLIGFLYLFEKESLKEELIWINKTLYPNSKSYDNERYSNSKLQLENGLAYIFKSHYNGILNDYREYIDTTEKEFIDLGFQHINMIFNPSYEARTEIIANQKKYLDLLWIIIQEESKEYLQ